MPVITINGVTLTDFQVLTVHSSLQSMAMSLQESPLGDDEHGQFMTKAYLDSIALINKIYIK